MKLFNLANLSIEEMNKINVDLSAASVAYKERMNIAVQLLQVENKQPKNLKTYFRDRLEYYRLIGKKIPHISDSVYKKHKT